MNLRTSCRSSAEAATGQQTALQRRGRRGKPRLYNGFVRPLWRQYATLFGSDRGSFDGSMRLLAQQPFPHPLRPLRLWMRPVRSARDHADDLPANGFSESGGSQQCHHGIDRRRNQLDAFRDSGIDQLGVHRARVVPGRRSADHSASPPVARAHRTRSSHAMHEEHGRHAKKRAAAGRTSRAASTPRMPPQAASAAKGLKKAGHVYTNDDVTRQNDNNGTVKYGGKTEKM